MIDFMTGEEEELEVPMLDDLIITSLGIEKPLPQIAVAEMQQALRVNIKPKEQPLDTQVGGDHYKSMAIQPLDYILANKLTYIEGNLVKYASRYIKKNGPEDLRKIIHYCKVELKDRYGEDF